MLHRVPVRDLPSAPALFKDHWAGAPAARGLLPRHFLQPGAFAEQAALLARAASPRAEMAAILRGQNERMGAGRAALDAADRLGRPGSLVVVGGQQAGLFGGPLYTVHKALTILALARHAEAELGVPVVPVFWIASEDSDLAEIDHAWITDRDGALRSLRMPAHGPAKIPVSRVRVGEAAGGLLAELRDILPAGGFSAEIVDALRAAYTPGRTYPQAFAAWMAWLFRDKGLVLLDPSDDRVKRLACGLFECEIRGSSPVTAAVLAQTARIRAAGYEPQIELREGYLTLFHQDPARDAILVKDGRFELKGSGVRLTADELCARLAAAPSAFTPNAVLRPLFQDAILPTLAAVLGPAEIAYYAQLTLAYERLGVVMPLVIPRASLTLVEPSAERLRGRLGVTFPQLLARGERVIDDILRREVPPGLTDAIAAGREATAQAWAAVTGQVETLDRTLRPTADIAAGRAARQFDFMEKKVAQAARRRSGELRAQVARVTAALAPRGGLQERTLCALRFLSQNGTAGLDAAAAALDPFAAEHRAVLLDGGRP